MIEYRKIRTNVKRNEYLIFRTDIFKNVGMLEHWNIKMLE
jgi:hypothetical protein